jgi:hypothetical protein
MRSSSVESHLSKPAKGGAPGLLTKDRQIVIHITDTIPQSCDPQSGSVSPRHLQPAPTREPNLFFGNFMRQYRANRRLCRILRIIAPLLNLESMT